MKNHHEIKFDSKEMFYTLHTNFPLTENIVNEIKTLEGIDRIDWDSLGNYTVHFTVGNLFHEATITKNLSKMLKEVYQSS